MKIIPWWLALAVLGSGLLAQSSAAAAEPPPPAEQDFQIEVTKKGLGKEVSIRQGHKEWFMMIEVTPDNSVVIRQEKENETYLLDESETHDRAMSAGEVDTAIQDFINSVKTKVNRK